MNAWRIPSDVASFPWGAAAILLLLALLAGGLLRLGAEPLRVELYGDHARSGAAEIAHALRDVRQRGFFGARVDAVQDALADLPWLDRVEVEFLWPNRLALRVQEHQPLANLATGGVLARSGRVIAAPAMANLPTVRAAPHRLGQMAALMSQVEAGCGGCRIADLDLGAGGQLAVRLSWGEDEVHVELGRSRWDQALQRLTGVALPTLQSRLAEVAAIDLRHRHAFAVRWDAPESAKETS